MVQVRGSFPCTGADNIINNMATQNIPFKSKVLEKRPGAYCVCFEHGGIIYRIEVRLYGNVYERLSFFHPSEKEAWEEAYQLIYL